LITLSWTLKSKLNDKEYMKKFNSLTEKLIAEKFETIIANAVELIRLLISVLILVFLREIPAI
jgi:hypothetical protein